MEASWLKRNIPILSWLPNYNRGWLTADAIAGLTVWGLVVPESMAYAGVAGLPPQFGLYTLAVSLLVYALLGSSRHLFVQPTSATAALIASTVTAVIVATGIAASSAEIDPLVYQQYAGAFVLVVGFVFLFASLARLGFITQFLSKPVLDGFVTGLAVYVMVGQLNKLFGVEKPGGNTVQKFFSILRELPESNWVAFALGVVALVLLTLIPRWNKKIPAGLIVLFGSIILSSALMLNTNYGVEVVGELPQGLPSFSLPAVPLPALLLMVAPAIGVLLVSFSQSLGVAREYSDKHNYEITPNTELTAFSAINLASGLFGGQIAGGSMAPSAVNDASGGRSEVSSLVAWGAVILTLLFLTPLFRNLPETILAALIIHALWHIVASRKLHYARLVSRTEFALGLLTFAGVIFIDVLQGMLIGLVSAILVMILRSSRPHVSRLGKSPDAAGRYSDIGRHPECVPVPGVFIARLDAPLYYANALTVRDHVIQMIKETEPPPRAVLFDAAVQDDLDITSSEMLKSLVNKLHSQGLAIYFAEVHKPVMEFSAKTGLLDLIGAEHVFPTVEAAVHHIEATLKGE
jgi:sulfate permease, SulP family